MYIIMFYRYIIMSEQRVVIVASGGGIPSVSIAGGGAINVSGSAVTISGNFIQGAIQFSSGYNHVYIGGSGIFCVSGGAGSANSGGAVLASCGPIISATLRSMSGNGPMMIGGTSIGNYPTSGIGMELFAGETMTLRVTNTNQLSVYNESGNISGQFVNIIATCGVV